MPRPKPIGKLPPRYRFLLNRHADARVSRCPLCQRPTHRRKFAFLVHVEGWGPLLLGKTGPFCSPCELIVLHQDELETELTLSFNRLKPEATGSPYLVVGTVDRRFWKTGLAGNPATWDEMRARMAEFKKIYRLE